MALLLKKRFLSSPWSFARTLELYERAATAGGLPDLDEDDDEYYQEVLGSGQSDEEEGDAEHPEFTALRQSKGSDPLVAATAQEINGLVEWGHGYEHRPDSRLQALITFLDAVCRPDGRTWTNERVVVFTEYAATLDWIAPVLAQRGYRDVLATIQGSTPADDREDIRAAFTSPPTAPPGRTAVRVLVATDSAGEGIDLQDHCHRLVNFDVPFNPSRLEQRIGRIDRYGRQQVPEIYHFAPDSTASTYAADMDFLRRIAEKVGTVAHDLGSVNQVIDDDVQQHFAGTGRPRRGRRAPESGDAIITRALAGGIELNRRLTELSRTYAERKVEMHLTPGNSRRVVDAALTLTAQPPLLEVGDPGTDAPGVHSAGVGSGVAARAAGARHPARARGPAAHHLRRVGCGQPQRPRAHPPRPRVDAAVHPVAAQRAVRRRVAGAPGDRGGRRGPAAVVRRRGLPAGPGRARRVAAARGGVPDRDPDARAGHGGGQGGGGARRGAGRGAPDPGRGAVRAALAQEWNADGSRLRTRLLTAMTRKAASRQEKVAEALDARRTADVARAREIFGAFRANLRESRERLAAQIRTQEEMLFTDDQQKQRRRDLDAMRNRLESLDEEEQRDRTPTRDRAPRLCRHCGGRPPLDAVDPEYIRGGGAPSSRHRHADKAIRWDIRAQSCEVPRH